MTKQDAIDNPNSCWNKAALDEPIFILRASDILSPALVREWARQFAIHRLLANGMSITHSDKYREAMQTALAMEARTGRKIPNY